MDGEMGILRVEPNNILEDDLEEGFEEDETPFITSLRLKEVFEQFPQLTQLEQLEEESLKEEQVEVYEKTESSRARVRIIESQETVEKDKEGNVRLKTLIPVKSLVHEEKLQIKKKNPDLVFLCNISNSKIYYNIPKDEFWLEVYQPTWINHKRTLRKVGSVKLEQHDLETMKILGILYERNFNNPLPQTIYVKKRDRRKAKQIKERFDRENL